METKGSNGARILQLGNVFVLFCSLHCLLNCVLRTGEDRARYQQNGMQHSLWRWGEE